MYGSPFHTTNLNEKREKRNSYKARPHNLKFDVKNTRKTRKSVRIARLRDEKYAFAYAESAVESIDGRQGVDMVSRPITSIAERLGYTDEHDMSDATIKEMAWDLTRMIERPTLVSTFGWNTGSSHIWNYSIPGDMLSIELVKVPFRNFQYWRGDVILRLQVAGSPLLQGILAMTFVPLITRSEGEDMLFDVSSMTINPTVYLYANTNTMAELRIPYNHVQSYLPTDFVFNEALGDIPDYSMGRVLIWVLEPLIAVGGVGEITCSLFSIMENNQFKVPRNSASIARAESFITSALDAIQDIGGSLAKPVMQAVATTVKDTITSFNKNSMQEVEDHATSSAMPLNFIGDVLDTAGDMLGGVLSFMGLDNPTIPVEKGRQIIKANGSMNYAQGPEHIEKLQVVPASMSLVTAETFGSLADEMDLTYLTNRYSYFGSFTVTTSQTSGTLVFSVPLSPFPTLINKVGGPTTVTLGQIVQQTVHFPLLSYLAQPFRYWTGGLRYKMLVSASMMQTCKLFCAFNYGLLVAPTTSLVTSASQYGSAIEITQGSNEFEFTVPYIASTPYKDVFNGIISDDNTMGTLNIYVMNSLIGPSSVAPQISIAMFIAGGEDFSYEMIGGNLNLVPTYIGTSGITRVETENMATRAIIDDSSKSLFVARAESAIDAAAPTNLAPTVTDMAEHEDQEEVAPPQLETSVDNHFGITHISVREYLKRYQCVLSTEMTSLYDGNFGFAINPTDFISLAKLATVGALTLPSGASGILAWASGMFRQFRGSLRWKIAIDYGASDVPVIPASSFSSAYAVFVPGNNSGTPVAELLELVSNSYPGNGLILDTTGSFYLSSFTSSKCTVLNGRVSNVLEFETPYSSRYLSLLTHPGLLTYPTKPYFDGMGRVLVYTRDSRGRPPRMTVYLAFGDETRFGSLYNIPKCFVSAAYTDPLGSAAINVGYAQYPAPAVFREFNIARAESFVQQQGDMVGDNGEVELKNIQQQTKVAKSTPANSSSLRHFTRNYKTITPRNVDQTMSWKIDNFVRKHPGCQVSEVEKYLFNWGRLNGVPRPVFENWSRNARGVNYRAGCLYPKQAQIHTSFQPRNNISGFGQMYGQQRQPMQRQQQQQRGMSRGQPRNCFGGY